MAIPIEFTFDFDTAVFDALDDALERAPRTMQRVIEGPVRQRLETKLLAQLRTAPGPPPRPIRWGSVRQRRAVMAKLRRQAIARGETPPITGAKLAYRRTGLLANSWDIEFSVQGADMALELTNDASYAPFVVDGPILKPGGKQPMFPNWYDVNQLVAQARGEAEDDIVDAWFAVLDTPGVFA
jgi:hypothetical protein